MNRQANIMNEFARSAERVDTPNVDSRPDPVSIMVNSGLRLAAEEGITPVVAVAQILMTGAALGGSLLTWNRGDGERCGRPSGTFIGSEEELPSWFEGQIAPLNEWQANIRRMAADQFDQIAAARKALQRQHTARILGGLIPELQESAEPAPKFMDPEFLVEIRSRIMRPAVTPNTCGRDRLVALKGIRAYRALMRPTRIATPLRQACRDLGGGLRATLHGWVPAREFHRLVRGRATEEADIFGWLLPAHRVAASGEPQEMDKAPLILVYEELLGLRFDAPMKSFGPDAEIAAMLDRADLSWTPPSWCGSKQLQKLLRPDESLAWLFAATMRTMSRKVPRSRSDIMAICELAACMANWIRAAHAREIRLLFPGPPTDPTDDLSCKLADKLRLGRQSTRQLLRGVHKARVEHVREELERMQNEGWVARVGRRHWQLSFPPLPDLSAKLSTIAAFPTISRFHRSPMH